MMMSDERHPRPKDPVHPSETVIHHYGDDETLLARWLRHGIEKGPGFWALVAGVIVVALAAVLLLGRFSAVDTSQHKAWIELATAKTPDEQETIAESYPKTRAALWAQLQSAEALFNEGTDRLATGRDAALPLLSRAYERFEQVSRAAQDGPLDDLLKRLAALGKARTKEARGELDSAIELYKVVASTWPGTPEAERAAHLAEVLRQPQSIAFYQKLSAYKPSEVTLPPMGTETFGLPGTFGLPAGHPPLDSPSFPGPLRPTIPPPPPSPESIPTPKPPGIELPKNPFENLPPLTPPDEAPKSATPTGELPGDVFAPSPKS
jgi:hypothetical protein